MKKWISPLLFASAFVALSLAERRRPLRRRAEPEATRWRRNLAMAGLTAAVTAAVQKPLVGRALRRRETRRPEPLRFAVEVLLLDYTLWWWHWLNHVAPPLWRFHRVHHTDRDLDVSTAVRFHFGEMALAALFRAVQIRVLGIDAAALIWWQRLLLLSILFHHSNLRLPEDLERRLVRVFVTPRMHGIHHSVIEEETNSNWSSLFSWWDMLHGTFVWNVPQEAIIIGSPDGPAHDLNMPEMLLLPARA